VSRIRCATEKIAPRLLPAKPKKFASMSVSVIPGGCLGVLAGATFRGLLAHATMWVRVFVLPDAGFPGQPVGSFV